MMEFKSNIRCYVFAGKNRINFNFCPIWLSERNMGVVYIDRMFDHEKSLKKKNFLTFLK